MAFFERSRQDAGTERLGQYHNVTFSNSDIADDLARIDHPSHCHAILDLVISNRMPSHDCDSSLGCFIAAATEDFRQDFFLKPALRKAYDVQGSLGLSTHC